MREVNQRKEEGITILVLTITIIILLILAGITITLLTGENGLIKNAGQAKEETEISNEKEIVDMSSAQAMAKNNRGILEEKQFQEFINNNTGGKAEVTNIGDEFEVYFKDTQRFYLVDKYGNISGELEKVKDQYPGDITKDENGNDLDGTTKPYQINCIEDLVALSNMVNRIGKVYQDGKLIDAENSKTINAGTKIVLTKNLNFKSRASYVDSKRTDFGDINEIEDENILIEELASGLGFRPIGFEKRFEGNFDGQNNKIEGIYINNTSGNTGLFGIGSSNTIISNLEISGEITGVMHTGGIIGRTAKKIENCVNRANITGYNGVGGIAGLIMEVSSTADIVDCYNYGNVNITGSSWAYSGAGGIVGFMSRGGDFSIINCTNEGNISGKGNLSGIGGIVGCINTNTKIINCCNIGTSQESGIVGFVRAGDSNIVNTYNLGKCKNGITNVLNGGANEQELGLSIRNCFVRGEVSDAGILGEIGKIAKKITLNIENTYCAVNSKNAIIGTIPTNDSDTEKIINIKNVYYDENKSNNVGATEEGITKINIQNNSSFVDILNNNIGQNTEWKEWKMGKDGYPIFI